MTHTILNVAYPLAPVGPDAAGGAEQVLTLIDAALVRAGHRSVVVACEGSKPEGLLVPIPCVHGTIDDAAKKAVQEAHRAAIEEALELWDIDVVHMHGLDFDRYLPPPGVPVLVTLHLPPQWYSPGAFRPGRPETYLHCVSAAQRDACPQDVQLLPEIENGVPADKLFTRISKRNFVLSLGRICPEKGYHVAFDAAARAGVPMVLAGEVYRYEAHMRYFAEELMPRLDGRAGRFIGPVGFERKRRLLSAARCLLVPSLAPETSSLVAMEALACGTPVIAFPAGALTEIIEHGMTGFIVQNMEEMADAIGDAVSLDPERCRMAARERFSADAMVRRYFELYGMLMHADG